MALVWETAPRKKGSSGSIKIIAAIFVIMIVIGTGSILITPNTFSSGQGIRIAVIDSGVDATFSSRINIVSEKSFVLKQYGYDVDDSSPNDSKPDGTPHGSLVAKTIAENYANALIINARVLGNDGMATTAGISAAIYWAVEENSDVINLSLGGTPSVGDPLEKAVKYAFSKGVIVVAAAGNEGDSGFGGSSINTPGISVYALSVGALDSTDSPAYYTSIGPTYDGVIKPDISTTGEARDLTHIYYGTSFAAPRVSAAAAQLIAYCKDNDVIYNAGTIMTLLLKSATPLSAPSYFVGAGKLNVNSALSLLQSSIGEDSRVKMSYVLPETLPVITDRLFYGTNYTFNIHLFSSGYTTFEISDISDMDIYDFPETITINQTGLVQITLHLPDEVDPLILSHLGSVHFTSDEYGEVKTTFEFMLAEPRAKIAFDISHTLWAIDSIYGQFREFYLLLTHNNISVTEIRYRTNITLDLLQQFDAVVVLDPCVWDVNETDPLNPVLFSLTYNDSEIQAYHEYYDAGGGIFVVGLSNDTLDVNSLNEFLAWSNFSLDYSRIDMNDNPVGIEDIAAHSITDGVTSFDYLGAPIVVPSEGIVVASYMGLPVLGILEGANNGRIVVTGTNYFIDNWGLNGRYISIEDDILAYQIVQWIAGML